MHPLARNPSFVRFLAGRLVTNVGDSLYAIAAMWLVYELTGSAFYTGLAGALVTLPQGLQFLVGPLVDRWPIRRILVVTQLVQAGILCTIPLAAWAGALTVWQLLLVMPLLSMLNQFVYPAQNSALPRIVDEEHIVVANSAFSFAYQGVDTAFRALGGLLVAAIGAIAVFTIDIVTFVFAAALFAGIVIPGDDHTEDASEESYRHGLAMGMRYVRGSILVPILVGTLAVNFTIGVTIAALPPFADIHGGSDVYGFLLAATAAGMLAGAFVASWLDRYALSHISIASYVMTGVFWCVAVSSERVPLLVLLFAVAWLPIGATNVISAAMLQTVVAVGYLGRVTSLVISFGAAAVPVGSLLGGTLAEVFGAATVVFAGGIGFLGLAVYWLVHPDLRTLPRIAEIEPAAYGLGAD